MIGYITIRGVIKDGREGMIIDCNVRDTSILDRFLAIRSLERALHLNPVELRQYSILRDSGFFDNVADTEDLGDKEGIEDA